LNNTGNCPKYHLFTTLNQDLKKGNPQYQNGRKRKIIRTNLDEPVGVLMIKLQTKSASGIDMFPEFYTFINHVCM